MEQGLKSWLRMYPFFITACEYGIQNRGGETPYFFQIRTHFGSRTGRNLKGKAGCFYMLKFVTLNGP